MPVTVAEIKEDTVVMDFNHPLAGKDLIFEVEVVFLFPWAVIFQDFIKEGNGMLVFVEMAIFLFILIVGLAYVWQKTDLDWVKRKIAFPSGRYDNQLIEDSK